MDHKATYIAIQAIYTVYSKYHHLNELEILTT